MTHPTARRSLGDVLRRRFGRGSAPGDPATRPHVPVLTVVVPVYNVAPYLAECLDSLLGQSLTELEVIAVDDGSTDGCGEILERYAERDPRLRVLTQENAGQGAARNLGVTQARGEFLTFCDSDDTVPPRAYAAMVDTLRRSGSDFVVGAARRVKHDRARRVAWGQTVHGADRIATTIDDFPAAMQDIIACNRVFRTEFWRSAVGGFGRRTAYEDHVPMLAAYVRAERFDVLARVTYHWRMREDRTSTGQQKASLQNLQDRIAVKQEAHELLRAEASEATYDAWVGRCLDVDFPPFLEHAITGSKDYRDALATTYATFLERANDRALESVRHDRHVRAWLCADRQWGALAEADEHFRRHRSARVRVEGDRVVAVPDLRPEVSALVPARAWTLADSETMLQAAARTVRCHGSTVEILGYGFVPGLESGGASLDLELDDLGGGWVALPTVRVTDPQLEQWAEDGAADHTAAGFAATIDLAPLVDAITEPTTWRLRLRLRHGSLVRTASIHQAVPGSAADRPRQEVVAVGGRPVRVEPTWDAGHGLQVMLEPSPVTVADLTAPAGVELRGRLGAGQATSAEVVARASVGEPDVAAVAEDGSFTISLADATAGQAGGPWTVRVRRPGVAPQTLLWPDDRPQVGEAGAGQLVWRPAPDGAVEVVRDGRGVLVQALDHHDDRIVVRLAAFGLTADELATAHWASAHATLPAPAVEMSTQPSVEPATVTLTVATLVGDDGRPAPSGAYTLRVRTSDGMPIEARASDALAATLPISQVAGGHRATLRTRANRTVVVDLQAPLDDEERSPLYVEGRRRERRAAPAGTTPQVLLHAGGAVADSPQALGQHLARVRPEVTSAWAVRDLSVVPATTPHLLIGSRGWYDALDNAPMIWTSGDLPDHVTSGSHQRIVQTFAGFPVRALGTTAWRSRGLSARAVDLEVQQRRRQWDFLVAPTAEVAEIYRRELEYDGPVLVTGYPRCDDLVTRDRSPVRRRTLAALGLPEETTVVLAVREPRDRATRALVKGSSASELDLLRLARGLGSGHVLLTLGHADLPTPSADAARVVGCDRSLPVNDLLLAADVAVLDYSNLRFDWALTGRAAVFHVPDRDAHLEALQAPIDYDTTTPGPQVDDVDAVVDLVRDHVRVRTEHADAVSRINVAYNALHDGRAAARVLEHLERRD